ncbi:unnamed protein product [Clonostachys rosea]|uniref:Extracellular membrane protein CFEM domain-containing protein n=1 Tax=Bionectria ochroleuca TaxID=29856 RepID=A0ABY6U861_BIOOC|nr:unnamed protein product [Clonostachys rosea]
MALNPSPILRDIAELPEITPAPVPILQVTGLHARDWAQPSNCVDEFSAEPTGCSSLKSMVADCKSRGGLSGDDIPAQSMLVNQTLFTGCFCQQDLLSHVVECQNEHRLCIQDYLFDPEFNRYREQWASFCSSASPSLSVTTPSTVKVTFKANTNTCAYLSTACVRYSRYINDCNSQYEGTTYRELCYCQSHVQVVESLCSINGGAICSSKPVDLTRLWGYDHCATFLGNEGTSTNGTWRRTAGFTATGTSLAPLVDYPLTYNSIATETRTSAPGGSTSSKIQQSRRLICTILLITTAFGLASF